MEPKDPQPQAGTTPPVPVDAWGLPVPEPVDQAADVELGYTTPDEPDTAW